MSTDCFVSWFISEKCNFKCRYCSYGAIDIKSKTRRFIKSNVEKYKSFKKFGKKQIPNIYDNIETIIANFKAQNRGFTFGFTGGETLIYPNFVSICERVIKEKGFNVALDTNLSVLPKDFIDRIPPERVFYITAALHIEERERIGQKEKFKKHLQVLLEHKYRFVVPYVLHPTLLNRFEDDYKEFADIGVRLSPKPFKGVWNGQDYPNSYSEMAHELLTRYAINNKHHFPEDFSRKKCNAGMSIIRVNKYGDVQRCNDDISNLGNIFTGFRLKDTPTPCKVKRCSCFSEQSLFGKPDSWTQRNDLQAGIMSL